MTFNVSTPPRGGSGAAVCGMQMNVYSREQAVNGSGMIDRRANWMIDGFSSSSASLSLRERGLSCENYQQKPCRKEAGIMRGPGARSREGTPKDTYCGNNVVSGRRRKTGN